jgi:hypothetical protein
MIVSAWPSTTALFPIEILGRHPSKRPRLREGGAAMSILRSLVLGIRRRLRGPGTAVQITAND